MLNDDLIIKDFMTKDSHPFDKRRLPLVQARASDTPSYRRSYTGTATIVEGHLYLDKGQPL